MEDLKFKALVVTESSGKFFNNIEDKKISELPAGEVLINVKYSSLNYKDALSANGNRGVTRHFPHTPGIDAAGIVVESSNTEIKEGSKVIVTGYDLGMNTSGGFGQYIRIPAEWATKLPNGLSLKESMIYGTAGFTAALAIDKLLLNGISIESGEILVTGASGGVGSMAVSLLSKLGFSVTASTGKTDMHDYLKKLGADKIINREMTEDISGRALLPTRWGGVIDSVGGTILTGAIKSTKFGGSIAACGLTQSPQINSTVYPFILRGVNLLGIDSAHCATSLRNKIWSKLADDWKPDTLEYSSTECTLSELGEKIELILQGKITGRTVVNLDS